MLAPIVKASALLVWDVVKIEINAWSIKVFRQGVGIHIKSHNGLLLLPRDHSRGLMETVGARRCARATPLLGHRK